VPDSTLLHADETLFHLYADKNVKWLYIGHVFR